MKAGLVFLSSYTAQVSQLAAPQLEQAFPPTAELNPLPSVEKQAKEDNTRGALCWH